MRGAVGGHGHAWNVILIRGKPLLVDTMWEPGSFFDLDSDEMPPYARLMDDATAAQATSFPLASCSALTEQLLMVRSRVELTNVTKQIRPSMHRRTKMRTQLRSTVRRSTA